MFLATLWAALTLNFILPRIMPGSPVDAALAKLSEDGVPVTNATRAAIEAQLGLPNTSLFVQYGRYLVDTAQLRFGMTYSFPGESVTQAIAKAAPYTLVLIGVTTVVSFIVGTLLGVYAGWKRETAVASTTAMSATFFASFPNFWIGLLLIYFLAFKYRAFPLNGAYYVNAVPHPTWSFVVDAAYHAVLPAASLIITALSGWLWGMRNNMINTLGEDFVVFAEANGLRARTVALLYVARNALLPNFTSFGLALGAVIGGSVLVESVFGYPGLGSLLLTAVTNRDYPLMQAIFLLITVSMLVAIFLVDILYGWLDPRVRRA